MAPGNRGCAMSRVAVVAHSGKSLGGGLRELREVLAREGVTDPLWHEVTKSRKAPKHARRALEDGAEVIFVWGGDGMVQRCVDALAGTQAVLAIVPAGTASLLAANLRIPGDLIEAVRVWLYGDRRPLDTGSVNREHFAVTSGLGRLTTAAVMRNAASSPSMTVARQTTGRQRRVTARKTTQVARVTIRLHRSQPDVRWAANQCGIVRSPSTLPLPSLVTSSPAPTTTPTIRTQATRIPAAIRTR